MRSPRLYLSVASDGAARRGLRGLLRSLAARGLNVYVRTPDARQSAEIERALRGCDALAVIPARDSDPDSRMMFEIGAALALRKQIILISEPQGPASRRPSFPPACPVVVMHGPAETAAGVAAIVHVKQERMVAG